MKNNGLLTKISAAVLCAALICSSISLTAAANSRVPIWDNGTSGSTAPFSEFLTAAGNAVTVSGTSVTLNDNIEIDYGLEIDGNYSLDLNGYGILYTDDGYNSVITVRQGCTFVLNDSRPSNVNYLEFDITQSRAIRIADQGGNGRLTVNGGFIAGGTGKAATGVVYGYVRFGGGVLMEPNAGFIMNGGTICGNGALPERQNTGRYIYYDLEGAGVFMYGSNIFKMTGGEIRDNNTSRSSVSVSGTFEMTGGKIFDNDNYYSDNSFDGVVYSRGSVIRVSAHAYISGDYINIQSSNEPITVTGQLYSDAYLCVYTENNEDRTVAFGGAGYSVSSSDALKFHSYYGSEPAGTVIDGGVRFHEVLSPAKLVLSPDSMIYTGDPVTLGVIYDGSALNGSRYTLTYAKNGASVDQLKETGTYSVTVTGRNHYSGSVTKNFVINMPYNMPEPTFTVTNSGSTFTVTRSVSWKAQTVYYRTVGLSAIAGVHFTGASGTLTFDVGETSKTVTVTELSNFGTVFKYQSGTSRTYRFEVLDEGGFRLAYKNKSVSCGSSTSVAASDFEVKNVTVFTDTVSVTDGGYDQAYHDVPVSSGYFGAYAAKEYLTATGAQLRMTVSFNAREKDDGYQYIQIYANDTTHVDTGAKDGDPGTLEYSYYMAGFTIDGNVSSTYYPYVFPLTSKGNACGSQTHPWSGNEKGNLEQQYFKSGQRASDGRLIIPTNLNSLRIRFDASGNLNDTWYVKDVYANIQAIDTAAPTLYINNTSYITISSGPYMTGNTVYVSVPFSEIVTVTGTPSLSTTWGTLSYISGSGSNVLTFAGLISASVGTTLRLKSISGTVKDLSGNQFTAYSSVSKSYSLAVAESFAFPVVYDLDGGSLPSGQSNPGTYTFTDTFTLATPVKDCHVFAGWVGTDLAERTETVTVPAGEHKNRYYKAEWRPVVSFVDYDGTELASYDFEINDVPEYTGETPTRADDVTAGETVTYAFAGWSAGAAAYSTGTALPAVTGPVTYTATYDLSHYYLITFENHDGTVLQQGKVLEGTTPVYTGETPTRGDDVTADKTVTYAFAGWSDGVSEYRAALPAVTGPVTYTVTYDLSHYYLITFENHDGTVLQQGKVLEGTTPVYTGETPIRGDDVTADETVAYAFAGWSDGVSEYRAALPAVTGPVTYTATYDLSHYYLITFENHDGTVLQQGKVLEGTNPVYTGETPARGGDVTADEKLTYAFAGWSDGVSEYRAALPAVTGPVTYTATYDLSHYYLITFENHDGTVLQQSWVLAGSVPEYTGTIPAKTSTAQYDFIFTGWDKQPAAVTGSETYTAVYSNDLRQYTVTFKNYDGTVLQSGPVYYGGTPAYSGETPSRPASGSVAGYFFAGWSPEISAVTGAAEYTAQFDALYTGTFGDGLSWTLFQGTLTVSGSGNMPNFSSYDKTPWYYYRKSITAVVIEGGITNVSKYAFYYFNNITSVTLCEGVEGVGMYAFRNCSSLNTVYLPRSMKTISNDAFVDDSALLADNGGNVYYAGSQTEWNRMMILNGNGPLTGANRHYALLSVDATDSLTPSRQIICSTSGAAENDTVTVTVKTADGVTCTGVTVTYDGNRTLQATAGADGVWTFTMPAYDVTVTAYCAGTPVTTLSIGDNSVYFGYTNGNDYGFTPDRGGWYVFSYAGGNDVAIRIYNGFDYACTVASSNHVESFSVPVYLNGGQTYAIQLLANKDFVGVINVSRNNLPLYAVNAAPDPHGVVDATSIEGTPLFSAPAGFEVHLKAYPDEGYKLSSEYYDEQFTVLDGAGNEVPINLSLSECYFTMPASPVTVYANYAEDIRYPITVVVDEGVTEYKLYDYDNNRYFISELVKPGTRITLDVFTFKDYEIISVTPDDIWENYCEMPDHPLTVTVITQKKDMPSLSVGDNVIGESAGDMYSFTPAQSGAYVLTTDAEGSLYYNIYSFADDHFIGSKYYTNGVGLHGGHTYFITLSAPAGTLTVTRLGDASFEYNVTVSQTAGGTVTAECAKANYNDMIKLTADPEPGYVFTGFVCTDQHGDPVEVATLRGEYYLAMPFSDVTVTARWRRLSFDTASVTLQNDLKINFKVRNEFFASGDCSAPYAIFEMNGRTVTVRDHETTIVNGKEYLVFSFLNVAPDMMNETITATLCASINGTEIRSTPVTYSISQYCRDLLGVTENRRLKMLLVDMLNYGAATQTYTGRGTDNLANKDLTDGQRGLGTQAEPALTAVTNTKYREVQSPEARWKAASLSLNDSITMQFKFSLDDMTGVTVVVEDENGVIDTVPADKISEIGGLRVVRLNGYTATQMRDPVYLTVCRDGLPISNTFAYSIESYAYAKKNDADENLAALVIAMMKYGIASAAYKG